MINPDYRTLYNHTVRARLTSANHIIKRTVRVATKMADHE